MADMISLSSSAKNCLRELAQAHLRAVSAASALSAQGYNLKERNNYGFRCTSLVSKIKLITNIELHVRQQSSPCLSNDRSLAGS